MHPPKCSRRTTSMLLALGLLVPQLLLASAGLDPARALAPLEWQRLALEGGDEAASALAFEPRSRRIAVGGERGVFAGPPDAILARVLRRGPIRDVAFLSGGAILAATESGLFRIDPDGSVLQPRVGAGEAANALTRIAVAGDLAAVASGSGVYVSRDGRNWWRLMRLPLAAASWVAARQHGAASELWAWIAGQAWVVSVSAAAPPATAGPARRVRVPKLSRDAGAVDAAFDLPDAEALLLYPSALLVRGGADDAWRVLRPALPPGASARRIAFALGRYWLATDAGLLVSAGLEGPWQRVVSSGDRRAVSGVMAADDTLLVAESRGVLRARVRTANAAALAPHPAPLDPDIRQVQRAALDYLSLEPARLRALQRGVARRGWLPILALRVGHDRGSARRRNHDQSVTSGVLHQLFDEQLDFDRDLSLDLTLSWDFGDLAYHPEEIDVLRESRAVIQLRDDVLDEVTQLYFERRRVLGQFAASEPGSAEAGSLALRADELSAGLDAWTGGWFSRQIAPP
jgi:hypothetical protein